MKYFILIENATSPNSSVMSVNPEKRFGVSGYAKFLFGHTSCKKEARNVPSQKLLIRS